MVRDLSFSLAIVRAPPSAYQAFKVHLSVFQLNPSCWLAGWLELNRCKSTKTKPEREGGNCAPSFKLSLSHSTSRAIFMPSLLAFGADVEAQCRTAADRSDKSCTTATVSTRGWRGNFGWINKKEPHVRCTGPEQREGQTPPLFLYVTSSFPAP